MGYRINPVNFLLFGMMAAAAAAAAAIPMLFAALLSL